MMVFAVFLSFFLVLITAGSNVILKKGLDDFDPFSAVYFSVLISAVIFWLICLFFIPIKSFSNIGGIIVFSVVGIFTPTIIRSLTYFGIDRLGAGRAGVVRALGPFFATIFAVLILKECPPLGSWIGLCCVTSALFILFKKDSPGEKELKIRHYIYPLSAAFLAGIIVNLKKVGLNFLNNPFLAAAIASTSSLLWLTVYIMLKRRWKDVVNISGRRGFGYILAVALLSCLGEIIDLSALFLGQVSLVIPILAIIPLAIILFSRIFLQTHEVITKRLVAAAIISAIGVIMITISFFGMGKKWLPQILTVAGYY